MIELACPVRCIGPSGRVRARKQARSTRKNALEATDPLTMAERTDALQSAVLQMKESARARDAQSAVEVLVQLSEHGVMPDLMAVTTALSACASAADAERAQAVFNETVDAGIVQPDELAFALLIKCSVQQNPPDWQQVAKHMGSMRFSHSITPTATTFAQCYSHNLLLLLHYSRLILFFQLELLFSFQFPLLHMYVRAQIVLNRVLILYSTFTAVYLHTGTMCFSPRAHG